MTICYFGTYDPHYSRNAVLLRGLKENRVTVLECRTVKTGFTKYIDLYRKHRALRGNYDAMFVAFPGQQVMLLARFITRKPIVFDAFTSLYDSMVCDRRLVEQKSIRAWYYWALDYLSMHFANLVLFDTNEHIEYVSREFSVPRKKLKRIFVGSSPEIYSPRALRTATATFTVLFFGTFIPLHGVEYIIEAAKLLEEKSIMFRIVGDGQEKEKIVRLTSALHVKNIEFSGNLKERELASLVADADVCLGIFGDTQKAQRVIPNKVYAYATMRKPIITGDTPAIRELFDERDMLLVPVADSKALAAGILKLKNNDVMRERFAENCHGKFLNYATPDILGRSLKQTLEDFLAFKE